MSPVQTGQHPPVGPITLKGQHKKAGIGRQESHGCPMGFVRPDLTSRCTWSPNETKQDLKTMTQGPHSIDRP